jgi:hypothetical protein
VNSLMTVDGGVVGGSSTRGRRGVFSNPMDRGTTTTQVGGGTSDWERLYEEDSGKGIPLNRDNSGIRAEYTHTVELEPV